MIKKITTIILIVLMIFTVIVGICHKCMVETKYMNALSLCERKQYDEALALFTEIQYYEEAKDFILFIQEMKLTEIAE